MKIFDIFRRFGKKESDITIHRNEQLPSELEKFRIKKGPIPAPVQASYEAPEPRPYEAPKPRPVEMTTSEEEQFYGEVPERTPALPPRPNLPEVGPAPKEEAKSDDKMDLVLQRLEIIDTRLKLIEERTRK